MAHVLLINPTPRRKKKRRPAARKRTNEGKTMARKTPKRGAGGRYVSAKRKTSTTRKRRTYRRNPESRATRSRAAKRGASRRRATTRRASTARRRTYRRNPARGKISRTLKGALTPALVFPAAAIGNDLLYNMLPLPAMLQSGLWKPVGKLGVASVLGVLSSFVLPQRMATLVTAGMVGGVILETGKDYLASTFPTLPLHGMANYPPMTYEQGSYLGNAGMVDANAGAGHDAISLGAYVDQSATGMPTMHGMGAFVPSMSNE